MESTHCAPSTGQTKKNGLDEAIFFWLLPAELEASGLVGTARAVRSKTQNVWFTPAATKLSLTPLVLVTFKPPYMVVRLDRL